MPTIADEGAEVCEIYNLGWSDALPKSKNGSVALAPPSPAP